MDKLHEFYQQFKVPTEEGEIQVIPLICYNRQETILTRSLSLTRWKGGLQGLVTYRVYRGYFDHERMLTLPLTTDIKEMMESFFSVLWTHVCCHECLELIPNNTEHGMCRDCLPMYFFWVWGIKENLVPSPPTCSICMESVSYSKLQCGHYFHKTCILRLNPDLWFDPEHYSETHLRCPLCRAPFTHQDHMTFFLAPQ